MGRNFVFGYILVFFFVFHAKSGTTNINRNGSSDISYKSPFNRDSIEIETFQCFLSVEKNWFEIFSF